MLFKHTYHEEKATDVSHINPMLISSLKKVIYLHDIQESQSSGLSHWTSLYQNSGCHLSNACVISSLILACHSLIKIEIIENLTSLKIIFSNGTHSLYVVVACRTHLLEVILLHGPYFLVFIRAICWMKVFHSKMESQWITCIQLCSTQGQALMCILKNMYFGTHSCLPFINDKQEELKLILAY